MGLDIRFMKKISVGHKNGCWLWSAYVGPNGYALHSEGNKKIYAHRFSYEALVGPIPDGMTIDHLCCVKTCVNPSHMEVVTRGENTRRGVKLKGIHYKLKNTHCTKGHEFNELNTRIYRGQRVCRACDRNRSANRQEKNRQA